MSHTTAEQLSQPILALTEGVGRARHRKPGLLARLRRSLGLTRAARGVRRTSRHRSAAASAVAGLWMTVGRPLPLGACVVSMSAGVRARAARMGIRELVAACRELVTTTRAQARSAGVQWTLLLRGRAEAGMSTAEYAVGTIAACGFAALLWKVVTSAEVRSMLAALIQKALKLAG
ncbi:hypothetical protein GCM10009530_10610 [Microbispora corallina]|uniref:DUF4244 domain-containing protein n=1 Tax=Microbispora corallina TaxID=83302 RepID=A0ABQ4FW28_9ACTN|nr:DUF4244 domain-containing protein [Microbispora corallina]GIH39024.1 hypothetical protein Mco01_20240 [Microbispora corallina]